MKLLILLIIALIFTVCKEQENTPSKVISQIGVDSSLLVVAVSDYYTFNFEKAALYKYSPKFASIDTCPLKEFYKEPSDMGEVTFTTTFLADTVFYGTILWMGHGEILRPNNQQFMSISSLGLIPSNKSYPHHIKRIDHNSEKDTTLFYRCLDTIIEKNIASLFKNGKYSSIQYLYTPVVGPINYNYAKWITFLFGTVASGASATVGASHQPLREKFPIPMPFAG